MLCSKKSAGKRFCWCSSLSNRDSWSARMPASTSAPIRPKLCPGDVASQTSALVGKPGVTMPTRWILPADSRSYGTSGIAQPTRSIMAAPKTIEIRPARTRLLPIGTGIHDKLSVYSMQLSAVKRRAPCYGAPSTRRAASRTRRRQAAGDVDRQAGDEIGVARVEDADHLSLVGRLGDEPQG